MKTAFKIQPPVNPEQTHDLMIEVGWEGISFVYYLIDPLRIEGLHVYSFDKNITRRSPAKPLEKMLDDLFPKDKKVSTRTGTVKMDDIAIVTVGFTIKKTE